MECKYFSLAYGNLGKASTSCAFHRIGREYNMGAYTHGGLINCKSLKSLMFVWPSSSPLWSSYYGSIQEILSHKMEWHKKLGGSPTWIATWSASLCSVMLIIDQASLNLLFASLSKSHWHFAFILFVLSNIFFFLLPCCYCFLFLFFLVAIPSQMPSILNLLNNVLRSPWLIFCNRSMALT
jgi:hypothetical protein